MADGSMWAVGLMVVVLVLVLLLVVVGAVVVDVVVVVACDVLNGGGVAVRMGATRVAYTVEARAAGVVEMVE